MFLIAGDVALIIWILILAGYIPLLLYVNTKPNLGVLYCNAILILYGNSL
jgi:hypothetical protein